MERTKRKNVFRAELIIFLAVIVVSLLVLWIRWENSHATYKNYDIVVKKNVYCEKTQTGRVDLQIRRKGGKKAKLLQTQQELKQSQSFQIVEDSYKLGIVDDASAYDGNIYEQKNAGGIQYLTLYYVNHEASGRQGKMHLVMNDAKTGKELINIKTSPKVKKDARRYEYRGKDLYVSEEGILLDAGTDEEFYNSQAMTAGLMTVCWKNGKEKQIQFDPNADVSEYEAADIIVPKVTSTGEEKSEENRCYYALELSDWENIREIKLGENVFAKAENLEKATDDLNKKKKKSKEEKAKEEAEKKAENQKKKECPAWNQSPGRCGQLVSRGVHGTSENSRACCSCRCISQWIFYDVSYGKWRTVRRRCESAGNSWKRTRRKRCHESTAKCGEPAEASDE